MAFRSNWIDALALRSITQGCMDVINRVKAPNAAVFFTCGENMAETAVLAALFKMWDCW